MPDKFEIYISVFAALISAAVSIYQGVTLFEMSVRMIVIIISFYIIGLIAKVYLRKRVFPEPVKPDDADDVLIEDKDIDISSASKADTQEDDAE